MNLRPLIMSPAVLRDIARAMKFAEFNRYSLHDMFKRLSGGLPPPGDCPNRVVVVPVGYRCVYSIEEQPAGFGKHLSVSVLGHGTAPSPVSVKVISEAFGFQPWNKDTVIWQETIPAGKIAINLVHWIQSPGLEEQAHGLQARGD